MKVETGYIYHIKDDFFDKINDKGLMIIMKMEGLDLLILLLETWIYYGLFR